MATSSEPPRADDADKLDWPLLRDVARRRLRARLSGFGATEIEDEVQECCQRMVSFVRRRGPPERPVGLMLCIVGAVAADAIALRQRDRRIQHREFASLAGRDDAPDEDEVLEEYRQIVELVRGYFGLKRAGCLSLADAKSRGESLKDFAERNLESYDKVRQAWSRCVKLIHDAIRKQRLRLQWPRPSDRKQPGAPDA